MIMIIEEYYRKILGGSYHISTIDFFFFAEIIEFQTNEQYPMLSFLGDICYYIPTNCFQKRPVNSCFQTCKTRTTLTKRVN
jgi:hypothetical protein